MASYQELLQFYQQNVPGGNVGQGTPAYGDRFNQWTDQIMKDLGVGTWDEIPVGELQNYETTGDAGSAGTTSPAEQQIWNQIAPGLTTQIQGDADRQKQVTDLTNQTGAAFGTLKDTLGMAVPTVDPATGKLTSSLLTSQNANADTTAAAMTANAATAAKTQLDALNQSITQMGANLQGSLAQQAAALQQTVNTLSTNLTTLDASQRKNLADSIASQQQNLETSLTAQRAALDKEVASLQGNASAAAQSRRAALEQEISSLTAAQGPLNEARLHAAQGLVTAVNLGLEHTTDQLKASAAANGYVGGSTMQDAALARAGIDARQAGANIVGGAQVQNASDLRDIGRLGATGGYSIADAYAGDLKNVNDFGAQTGAGLDVAGATGSRTLADLLATQNRTIGDTTATNAANLGNWGATTGLANTTAGITANRSLQDALATGTAGLTGQLATQTQAAGNQAALAKAGYSDAAYGTGLNAAQVLAGLPGAEASAKASLIPYGTAGTANALPLFNWFSSSATPPASTATVTPASSYGTDLSKLGSGLVGGAFQLGKDFWKPNTNTGTVPKTPTGTNEDGSDNPYT